MPFLILTIFNHLFGFFCIFFFFPFISFFYHLLRDLTRNQVDLCPSFDHYLETGWSGQPVKISRAALNMSYTRNSVAFMIYSRKKQDEKEVWEAVWLHPSQTVIWLISFKNLKNMKIDRQTHTHTYVRTYIHKYIHTYIHMCAMCIYIYAITWLNLYRILNW